LFSSPEVLTKLADVRIILDPIHAIKKQCMQKNLLSPAYHDYGYQLAIIKTEIE
jgi:hypothetical protein